MTDSFVGGQRIHLPPYPFASLERYFQIVAGDFYRQRIGDGLARTLFVLTQAGSGRATQTGRPSTRNLMSTASAWRVAMATISA